MNRDDAWTLLTEYTKGESLLKHALAVEAAVRGYARTFGEDEAGWGVVAVPHGFDYERWAKPRGPSVSRQRDSSREGVSRVGHPRDPFARRLFRGAARRSARENAVRL